MARLTSATVPAVPDDVAVLAATHVLGWLLTTTDRRVRDRATKAIVSVGERAPAAFARHWRGSGARTTPMSSSGWRRPHAGSCSGPTVPMPRQRIADGVLNAPRRDVATAPLDERFCPASLRRSARPRMAGPRRNPPYGAPWPVQARTVEEIEALAGPPDYAYGSIWHSLTGMGDFGRYVLQSALGMSRATTPRRYATTRNERYSTGYSSLAGRLNASARSTSGRSGGRDGPVERVGKKYQWIGFYEVLGRITDNHAVSVLGKRQATAVRVRRAAHLARHRPHGTCPQASRAPADRATVVFPGRGTIPVRTSPPTTPTT